MQEITGNIISSITGYSIAEFSASSLNLLTWIGLILLFGLIGSVISKKIGISNILFLILTGLILSRITYEGESIASSITESSTFLISVGILALVMIVFVSASKFKFKEFDTFSTRALTLSIVFLVLNLICLSISTYFIFGPDINALIPQTGETWYSYITIFLCLIFAVMMSGTDPGVVLTMLKQSSNRVIELLKIESLLNTPLTVLFPFILLDLLFNLVGEGNGTVTSHIIAQIVPFLNKFVAGIGAGVIIGMIILKLMKKQYSNSLSPLALVTFALLTYILAEQLGGNGVLAVTTLGLIFGNISVKQKDSLQTFSKLFSNTLEILVFVLIGLIIGEKLPFTVDFLVKSMALFSIYVVIRFIAVALTFNKTKLMSRYVNLTFMEMFYMTLNMPKGIAVAVLAFILSAHTIVGTSYFVPGMQVILNLTLAFMLYSIIISTIITKFTSTLLYKPKNEKNNT